MSSTSLSKNIHFLERAQELEKRGAWKEALSFYREHKEKYPQNAELEHRIIRCLFQVGEGSLSLLEDAAKKFPEVCIFHRDCVAVLLHQGEKEKALDKAKSNLLNFKGNSSIWVDYGAVLNSLGFQFKASEAYNNALSLDSDCEDAWFNWANMMFENKEYSTAEQYYLRASRINKGNEEVWLQLAYCTFFSKDYHVSLRYLAQGLLLKRREEAFYYIKSLVLGELGLDDEAFESIDKALRRSNDYEYWMQLIHLLRKKGEDTTEAERLAKQSIKK